jgi:hypothetical protein
MSVMARFGHHKAILREGIWKSADLDLERRLNEATTRWIQETGGPDLFDRDQEKSVAEEMTRRFDGTILLRVRTRSARSATHFYEQRQMTFAFEATIPMSKARAARSHS